MAVSKTRLIYTAGTFTVDDALAQCRRFVIYADVLRLPYSARYANERSNPIKRFLGYVSVFIGDYVYNVFPLEYDAQVILFWDNPDLQNHQTLLDSTSTIQNTIATLGLAIDPPAVILPIPGFIPSFGGCPYSKIKFKLEAGCRIQVSALGEEVEKGTSFGDVITVPALPDIVPMYSDDDPRASDPARSDPEPGELPGDTAPATSDDPDLGLTVTGTWLISWLYSSSGGGTPCTFVGLTDTIELPGESTDVFTVAVDGSDYRLYQNGVGQPFTVGTQCIPNFSPVPSFTPD